ncbi:MAG: 50S ribosomal protein L17 [Calditrichales bacterium]|nr:MAG: 50S ribosomal protein L17 [Calditrichales bacterium]
MRHKVKGRKLNRTASHRKALLRNLANQLFEHKEIKTTTAKAKEARSTVERLITYAKKGDLHHRRLAFSFLRQKGTINTLFDVIAPVYSEREGGYTRVLKLGRRAGDGAPMAILQLVGFEALEESSKPEPKKITRKKEQAIEDKPVKNEVKDKVVEPVEESEETSEEVETENPEENITESPDEAKSAEEASEEEKSDK